MKHLKQISLIVCALVVGFVSSNFMVRSVSADTELPYICTGCDTAGLASSLMYDEGVSQGAILNGSYININMSGMDFSDAQLIRATVDGSTFSGGSFAGADMRYALFGQSDSNFENVDFTGADMRSMGFMSSLTTINFDGADFTDANLTGTYNMDTKTSRTGAIWSNTICPDGTNSNSNSNTCEGHLTP
jgi:hypothetical protein